MPARIVIVHDDLRFLDHAATALRLAGYDVACCPGSMDGLHALEEAETVELLITRVRFARGTPHGISLAQMAKIKRPELKVLFTARRDMEEYTEGKGEFVQHSFNISELVERVSRILSK